MLRDYARKVNADLSTASYVDYSADGVLLQFPCGRVKRFLKNNTQNKMRVGAKGKFTSAPSPFRPSIHLR